MRDYLELNPVKKNSKPDDFAYYVVQDGKDFDVVEFSTGNTILFCESCEEACRMRDLMNTPVNLNGSKERTQNNVRRSNEKR